MHPRLKTGLLLLSTLWGVGCPAPPNPCEDVSCGEGLCEVQDDAAACVCNAGFHPEGTTCVADPAPTTACDPSPCVELNRGVCTDEGQGARCSCDPGYVEVEGRCLLDDPCDPNPCSELNRNQCVASGSTTTCECNPGFELELDVCVPVETFCAGEHPSGDEFEPDECSAKARDTGSLGVLSEPHTLEPAGDQDWFRLAATEGAVYRFSARAQGVSLSLSAKVFSSDGVTELATQSGAAPEFRVRASKTDALYFRVRSPSPTATGTYSVDIQQVGVDDHGDTLFTSTTWTPSPHPNTAQFEYGTDSDFFSFTAVEGHVYGIQCETPNCGVRVYGPTGELVARPSNPPLGKATLKLSAGQHHVQLFTTLDTIGAYTFRLEDLGTDDVGDTTGNAASLSPGLDQPGSVQFEGDVDLFRLPATAGRIYEFTCTHGSALANCNLVLLEGASVIVEQDLNGGDASVRYKPTANVNLYAQISAPAFELGSYNLRVNDLGVDDFGDELATANPLTGPFPLTITGRLELDDDQDFHSFQGVVGKSYVASCVPTTSWNCSISLRNAQGQVLATDGVGPDFRVSHSPSMAGALYVRISANGDSDLGHYSVTVTEVTDDHGNDPATASLVTLVGGAANGMGSLEVGGDRDTLAFAATAGLVYRITCTPTDFPNCPLAVLDANGTTLASYNLSGPGLVMFKASASVNYFVRLRSSNGSDLGAYSWSIEETSIVDDHGDSTTDATPVSLTAGSASGTGALQFTGDRDVLGFSALQGKIYRITCTETVDNLCDFRLLDGTGGIVASVFANSGQAELLWEAPSTAGYFVRIASTSSATGSYSWTLEETAITDDHGDNLATATPVVFSGGLVSGTGALETDADQDLFRLSAQAGKIYRFDCTPGGSWNCQISVRDSADQQLFARNGTVFWEAPASGDFYVRLSPVPNATGGYGWSFQETTLTDDHPDTLVPTATLLIVGAAPIIGQLESFGDSDYFQVSLTAGLVYEINNPQPAGVTMRVGVYDAAGMEFSFPGFLPRTFAPTVTGTYFLRLFGQSSASTGQYQLGVVQR